MLSPNFSPFPEIRTQRLLLRRITKGDGEQVFILRSSGDVMQYINRPRAATLRDAEIFIERIDELLEHNDGITWGITMKEAPGKLLGSIGLWRLEKENYRAELGYMLHPDYWQKGIMKEAVLALFDYAFDIMHLHSIEAVLDAENIACARLLESTGFVREAHFKENFFFKDAFRDTLVYSKLRG